MAFEWQSPPHPRVAPRSGFRVRRQEKGNHRWIGLKGIRGASLHVGRARFAQAPAGNGTVADSASSMGQPGSPRAE
jgi:hypothetical protein